MGWLEAATMSPSGCTSGHHLFCIYFKVFINDTWPYLHSPIRLPKFTFLDYKSLLFSMKCLASSDLGQEKLEFHFHSKLVSTQLFIKVVVVQAGSSLKEWPFVSPSNWGMVGNSPLWEEPASSRVEPCFPLAPRAAWRAGDLPPGLLISSWGMSNRDSPKCLNTRIEINVPSLLAMLTIHYSKHLPKVKWMFVYPHEIYIKTCWWKKP